MTATLAPYGHFLRLAARQRWDGSTIGFHRDVAEWSGLEPRVRERIALLVAGFCVGEARVAAELDPFAAASADPDAAACFEIQAVEERRHARFFDRWAEEVLGSPGETSFERAAGLARLVPPAFLELFEERLPRVTRTLAAGDREALGAAVGLYHMVLEGVVFTAGQLALAEELERVAALPGLRFGLDLVIRDEHWHMGFGARCLQDLGAGPEVAAALERDGEAAARAWGEAVGPELVERTIALHRRRLRAAGLASASAVGVAA